MNNTLVSIIIPCYNQGQYLEEALESVLNQTHLAWECIIVNDGSPDNTEHVALEWCKKDTRIKYLKKENGGLSAARNTGIAIAKAEFILPLDADDKLGNNYIEFALQQFALDATVKVVYCKALKFGTEEGFLSLVPYSLYNLSRNNMIFPSAMFRKKEWERVGGYEVDMIYGWEDWEFWIAVLKDGGNVKRIDEVCFYYRIKSASMLKSIDNNKGKFLIDYMSVKHADFFVKNYGSFIAMDRNIQAINRDFGIKLKSEKFVIDVFCKRFFGFTVFGKYK
jgi:glycosyltransferase involved in cell wall biosynthesis